MTNLPVLFRKPFLIGTVFAIGLVAPALGCAAVTDSVVKRWIVGATDRISPSTDQTADQLIAKARTPATLKKAWAALKECRDDGNSLDLDLASAEHYLFIRAFAAEKGERDIEALPVLYGALKKGLGPAADLIKTSNQPVSKVDPAVIAWGEQGVKAGLADFESNTGGKAKPLTGAFQQYKLAVEGYYDNYVSTTKSPKCRVPI